MRIADRVVWMMAIGLLSVASPVLARQPRTLGIVMGYPATVGVLWHISDRVALRPEFTISRQHTETTSTVGIAIPVGTQTVTTTSTGWTGSVGASALFYLGGEDILRAYVTPRLAYAWTRTDTESEPSSLTSLGAFESQSDGFIAAGSLGAQFAPHDRFRLFGELGLSYTRQDGFSGFSITRSDTITSTFGLRSGVGVVVYF